jgi:AraC-like DNA-binding protein
LHRQPRPHERRWALSYDFAQLYLEVDRLLNVAPLRPVAELSRELNVSRRTIMKAVQTGACKGLREWRNDLLIQRLRLAMQSSAMIWSIKELAFHAGYKSPRSFARAVRRSCGCTPQQLRHQLVMSAQRGCATASPTSVNSAAVSSD